MSDYDDPRGQPLPPPGHSIQDMEADVAMHGFHFLLRDNRSENPEAPIDWERLYFCHIYNDTHLFYAHTQGAKIGDLVTHSFQAYGITLLEAATKAWKAWKGIHE